MWVAVECSGGRWRDQCAPTAQPKKSIGIQGLGAGAALGKGKKWWAICQPQIDLLFIFRQSWCFAGRSFQF